MSGTAQDEDKDEAEIRGLAAWSRALKAKDLDGLAAAYAPDVLLFDLKPPFRMRGVEAMRSVWAACLPRFPAKLKSEHRDFEVTVGGDAAFAHCLHRMVPIDETSRADETWMRVTLCYRKIAGAWQVVHEHVSVPFDSVTGRVAYITDADML